MADEQQPADTDQGPQQEGRTMHIHAPRPLHGVRDFLLEIAVIVVGVLIALALEQTVQALSWRHKVAQADVRLRSEFKDDVSFAAQYAILTPCADAYLDRVQADLLARDSADMASLYALGPPFFGEPWKVLAWEGAVASQIGDHMPDRRYETYSEAFRGADLLRGFQFRFRDDYAAAMTGRFALAPDAKTQADELAAVDRLRQYIVVGRAIAANDLVRPGARVGIATDPEVVAVFRQYSAQCLALLGEPPSGGRGAADGPRAPTRPGRQVASPLHI
ncbi:MAG TPA: hypothetical protein VGS12_03790 [Caulobacteraceae bacterium]|nr:hypothetical protein [Caulobacteraceae bacterium]